MLYNKPVSLIFAILTSVILGGNASQADTVYVSNTGAGTISRIGPSGASSIFASGLDSPKDLVFDGAGNLYVADSGDGTILKFDLAGNMSTFATGLNGPSALAFDPFGNLYAGSQGSQTISKIDSSGHVSSFATGISFCSDGAYLAADNAGNIFANTLRTVEQFNSTGTRSTLMSSFSSVEGMAVDVAGHFYLALQNGCNIHGNGGLLTSIADYPAPYGSSGAPPPGSIDTPCDLVFDLDGNLFATFASMYNDGIGGPTMDNNVLIRFGADGHNSVVATDIGGTYIAVMGGVQSVPEPGIWALAGGMAAILIVRKRLMGLLHPGLVLESIPTCVQNSERRRKTCLRS